MFISGAIIVIWLASLEPLQSWVAANFISAKGHNTQISNKLMHVGSTTASMGMIGIDKGGGFTVQRLLCAL